MGKMVRMWTEYEIGDFSRVVGALALHSRKTFQPLTLKLQDLVNAKGGKARDPVPSAYSKQNLHDGETSKSRERQLKISATKTSVRCSSIAPNS